MLDIESLKKQIKEQMNKAIDSLKLQLGKVRTGRAQASILDGLKVNSYGDSLPIKQMGQISTPEARLLQIHPFDKTTITDIEKAILSSNLGLVPSNDGNVIRIPFPSLNEEKRKDLVKQIKKMGEDCKVVLRNVRRDENDRIKKLEKSKELSEDLSKKVQNEVQVVTDKCVKEIDDLITQKEKELLTI